MATGIELATAYVSISASARGLTRDISRELSGLDREGERAGRNMGGGIASGIKSAAGLIAGAVAAIGIGSFVAEAAKASDATNKFKSTMSFAGIDTSGIDAAKKAAQEYADQTVYDLPTIQNMIAQLASNGVQDYTGLTKAAGNLNAVAGGNAESFKSVAMVMTQTAGAGKLTTENWNQLSDAIPGAAGPLMKALADAGAYTGNFREAMEKGQITSDEFNAALMTLGTQPVAVEAAKSTETFEGALGNLQATINGGLVKALDAIKPAATTAITWLSDNLGKAFDWVGKAAGGLWDLFVNGDFTTAFREAFNLEEDSGVVDFLFKVRDAAIGFGDYVTGTLVPGLQDFGKWIIDNKDWISALAISVGTMVVGMKLWTGAISTWKTITSIAAGVQLALNAAMAANPIGLIVVGIAALVAGLVWFFTQTETGKQIVATVWKFIQDAIAAVVDWFNTTLVPAFQAAIKWVGDAFTWLYENIIKPVFDGIAAVIGWWWNNVVMPYFNFVAGALKNLGDFFSWLWTDIIDPVFQLIGALIAYSWNNIIMPVFNAVVSFIRDVVAAAFTWFYENVIKPVWDGISSAISTVWNWLVDNVFTPINNTIKVISDAFSWFWNQVITPVWVGIQNSIWIVWKWLMDNVFSPIGYQIEVMSKAFDWFWKEVITPVWEGIQKNISTVWDWISKNVFDPIKQAIEKDIPAAFENGKKFIDDIWKGIQDVVKAPVKFVVETVLNNGLIEAFNTVARFLGTKELGKIQLPQGFAEGGYTGDGGKYQPAGIVHAGEFVFTKEQTAKAGVGTLYALARTLNGYASGGLVSPLDSYVLTQGYSGLSGHNGLDMAAPTGTPIHAAGPGRVSFAGWGAGGLGGNEMHIDHPNGLQTWYAHQSAFAVGQGALVNQGQTVGFVGSTGMSSGPHLHYMVLDGGWPNVLDPTPYLTGGGAAGSGKGGGVFNPIAAIIDALVGEFKKAFPAGGFVIDLIGDVAKNILTTVSDFINNGFRAPDGAKGSATLFDGGGWLEKTAGPMLVEHRRSKPDAVLTNSQWKSMHETAEWVQEQRGQSGIDGATLTLQGVDYLADAVAARLELAIGRN